MGTEQRWCRWDRCYVPTLVFSLLLALGVVYLLWMVRGRGLHELRPEHLVMGLLLWWVLSPAIIGLVRGIRRHQRHLSRRSQA